jgi:hypothetical protein
MQIAQDDDHPQRRALDAAALPPRRFACRRLQNRPPGLLCALPSSSSSQSGPSALSNKHRPHAPFPATAATTAPRTACHGSISRRHRPPLHFSLSLSRARVPLVEASYRPNKVLPTISRRPAIGRRVFERRWPRDRRAFAKAARRRLLPPARAPVVALTSSRSPSSEPTAEGQTPGTYGIERPEQNGAPPTLSHRPLVAICFRDVPPPSPPPPPPPPLTPPTLSLARAHPPPPLLLLIPPPGTIISARLLVHATTPPEHALLPEALLGANIHPTLAPGVSGSANDEGRHRRPPRPRPPHKPSAPGGGPSGPRLFPPASLLLLLFPALSSFSLRMGGQGGEIERRGSRKKGGAVKGWAPLALGGGGRGRGGFLGARSRQTINQRRSGLSSARRLTCLAGSYFLSTSKQNNARISYPGQPAPLFPPVRGRVSQLRVRD